MRSLDVDRRVRVVRAHVDIRARTIAVAVFGACVMDAHARSGARAALARGTTTPGVVNITFGGVGYNIARGCATVIARAGVEMDVALVSVVGDDASGRAFAKEWASVALAMKGTIAIAPNARTAHVVCVMGDDGEIASAIADCAIVEKEFTPERARAFEDAARRAAFVVVDANLTPEAIAEVCKMCEEGGKRVWYEPVSVEKSKRIALAFGGARPMSSVAYASPNAAELREMANAIRRTWAQGSPMSPCPFNPSMEFQSASEALDYLASDVSTVLAAGCGCVVLTLGELGCVVSTASPDGIVSRATHVHIPAAPCREIVSVVGAGDALVAGAVAALALGVSPLAAIARGVACASFTCGAHGATMPSVDERDIDVIARIALDAARTLTPAVPQ